MGMHIPLCTVILNIKSGRTAEYVPQSGKTAGKKKKKKKMMMMMSPVLKYWLWLSWLGMLINTEMEMASATTIEHDFNTLAKQLI